MPDGLPVTGAVLADQVKSLDWVARPCAGICAVPREVIGTIDEPGLRFGVDEQVRHGVISRGFQPRTHAIVDYTNHVILNVYERALKMAGKTGAEVRPVIEHCRILRREPVDDLVRFGKLGVIANVQAVHATEDMVWAGDRVGPHRVKGGYAWRDLLDSGATVIVLPTTRSRRTTRGTGCMPR